MDPSFSDNTLLRTGLARLEQATAMDTPHSDPILVRRAYTAALDCLIRGLQLVNDPHVRDYLRRKMEPAMSRAEALQQLSSSSSSCSRSLGDSSDRSVQQPSARSIARATALAQQAVQADTDREWQKAYDLYKAVLEILVPLGLSSWKSRLVEYMERAEELAVVLQQQQIQEETSSSTTEVLTHVQRVERELSYCRERIQQAATDTDNGKFTPAQQQELRLEVDRARQELNELQWDLHLLDDRLCTEDA